MPVTIHLNGRSNSLIHKGSTGIAKSTIPDVCKTPSPGGPVPIPYPVIVSMSSDLANGSTTVKADGGNMAAIKGCEFGRCSGDEAGTAGGVKSSTNMKEAKFILYSFDVKIDGQNACRLGDKMTMNHENTMCLSGAGNPPVPGSARDEECKRLSAKIENIRKNIRRREQDKIDDKLKLPQRADGQPLRASVHGHDVLIAKDWSNLNKLEKQYVRECM